MNRRLLTMTSVLVVFVASASCSSLLGDFNAPAAQEGSVAVDATSDTGPMASDGTTDALDSTNATDATDAMGAAESTSEADSIATSDSSVAADGMAGCPAGQMTCGGLCTDTSGDVRNCGACGHDCNALAHVTGVGVTCAASRCNVPVTSCTAGYAHCSSMPDDGCEADVTKPARCGDCSTVCPSTAPVCTGKVIGSVTTYSCATGCSAMNPTPCTGTCTNLMTDPNNCSVCGKQCSPPTGSGNATCTTAGCGVACNTGYHLCNATVCADNTSPNSCGSLCTPCVVPNATAGCSLGACSVQSCNPGFGDCDGMASNGCETNLLTSVASCGSCGSACGGLCQSGTCWTPATLSGLALWLDASVGITLNGGNVTGWADRSKYLNNAVQYTLANTPAIGAFGTQKAVYFDDRNSSEMRIADSNTLQWSTGDFLIELVVQYNHYALARDLLIGKNPSTSPFAGPAIFINDPPDGSGKIRAYLDASNYVTSAVGGYNGSVGHIIGMHRAGTGVELRIDGVKSNSATLATIDVSAAGQLIYIGGHYPGGVYSDGYYGGIAEIIAAGPPISSTDITNVETYLKTRYGL